jgi:hypothetical protein
MRVLKAIMMVLALPAILLMANTARACNSANVPADARMQLFVGVVLFVIVGLLALWLYRRRGAGSK